jgi:hypothetical protein
MLFSINRHRPLFTVNPVLNEYLKNSEYKYMKNINSIIENRNKKKMIFAKNENNDEPTSLIIVPSIFFLSLTTIIYYFYSKRM